MNRTHRNEKDKKYYFVSKKFSDIKNYNRKNIHLNRYILHTSKWDLFFDLHGVLADVIAVNRNYNNYLADVLSSAGISREKAARIHEKAFRKWITEINMLFNDYDDLKKGSSDSEIFMKKYKMIDSVWEEFVLEFVSPENKNIIKPLLETSRVEYEALAHGPYPVLYPEVFPVLTKLSKIKNLHMHIASSASSKHVNGVIALHNLSGFFKRAIGYDTVRAPKKASSGIYFDTMLQITQANTSRTIFVGDSLEEANLALKHGMKFILVKREKFNTSKKLKKTQFHIVENLTAIVPIVNSFLF